MMEMPSPADLDELLAHVGPLIDAAEIRKYNDDRWAIAYDEDFVIVVEHDAARGVLVLTAPLGLPAAGCEAQAHKLLLQVAAWWEETGGLRMALDPDDDTVLQIIDLPATGLGLEALQAGILAFADQARHSRSALASLQPSASEATADSFIRV